MAATITRLRPTPNDPLFLSQILVPCFATGLLYCPWFVSMAMAWHRQRFDGVFLLAPIFCMDMQSFDNEAQ